VGKRVLLLLLAAFIVLTVRMEAAQSSSATTASDRKVASKVAPVYPELAKRMHLHGIVRVEAVVRPNGAVKSTRVLGGNPVLVDAALEAVGKWKFEPAQAETTEVVQVTFDAE
jgi:TonB family protein